MIKHIFSDMDGTLLNRSGQVTKATERGFQQVAAPLTLVSARAPMEMANAIERLGLRGPQIAFNGGLIYQHTATGWSYLSERSIDAATALALMRLVRRNFPRVSVSYYDRERWYTNRLDAGIRFEQNITGQQATIRPTAVHLQDPMMRVLKVMLITFDEREMAHLSAWLRDLHLPGVVVQQSGDAYLEITSAAARKSRGINYVLQHNHLAAADTAGFGDGYNDLPMLRMVGLPIVMANAVAEVQRVARFVTRSNEQDGVAYALTHLKAFR